MLMGKKPNSAAANAPDGPAVGLDVISELVCTNTAMRLAARRLAQLYDEALAPVGLKATQISLIAEIQRLSSTSQEGPTLQDLAARLALRISAVTHALKPLVRDGLIKLRQDAQDKRIKHSVLTALGRKRLSEALVLWDAANTQVEVVLGSTSSAQLRALADQVASEEFLLAYRAGKPGLDPTEED